MISRKFLSEIPEYSNEEKYEVYSDGTVVSYKGKEPRVLKGTITRDGYKTVKLTYPSSARVHRLIAMAFTDNPDNLPEVNHIDGNKLNNSVENLEWVTREHNMEHAKEIGLISDNLWKISGDNNYQYDKPHKLNTCVAKYDLEGNYIDSYYSFASAGRSIGKNPNNVGSAILRNIRGIYSQSYGYRWKLIKSEHVQRLPKHNIDELDSILNGVGYTTSDGSGNKRHYEDIV